MGYLPTVSTICCKLETCLEGTAELPLPLPGFTESFDKLCWFVVHCWYHVSSLPHATIMACNGSSTAAWGGFRTFGQCWAHAARSLPDVATRNTTSWTMPPFHRQWCLQTYKLGSQCLSLIGTDARSKLAAPQTTPMSAGQQPRGVQPESQKHCAESPPHKSGWLTPFHTLPSLNLCSADGNLNSQAYFARLLSMPRMTSSAHGTFMRSTVASGGNCWSDLQYVKCWRPSTNKCAIRRRSARPTHFSMLLLFFHNQCT